MSRQLKIIPKKCIGCKSCELACSLHNEGELNPAKSRISTITFIEGKYPLPYNFVSTCRQCADAPCLTACPTGAIIYEKRRPFFAQAEDFQMRGHVFLSLQNKEKIRLQKE